MQVSVGAEGGQIEWIELTRELGVLRDESRGFQAAGSKLTINSTFLSSNQLILTHYMGVIMFEASADNILLEVHSIQECTGGQEMKELSLVATITKICDHNNNTRYSDCNSWHT